MTPAIIAAICGVTAVLAMVTVSVWESERARTRSLLDAVDGTPSGSFGRVGVFDRRFRRTAVGRRATLLLAGAGLTAWTPFGFVTMVLTGALVFAVVTLSLAGRAAAVLLFVVVIVGVWQWLRRQQGRRIEQFIAQLPELARLLANGASAGLGVRRSLELAARELAEPARTEVEQVCGELALGQSMNQALQTLSERLPSRELAVLVHTLVIQHRAGGALVTALSRIATTLEERKQLRREARTAATGSGFSGMVVVGLAGFSVVVMNLMSPGVMDKMLGMLAGQVALVVAVSCFVVGFVLLRRVTKVDV
ncbi:MAG: type II secretion system F family protein [Micrococcales bacterium]|nr:type II secretion system F family protein [Micrococcales bacterium]